LIEEIEIKTSADIEFSEYGLEAFSEIRGFKPHPIEVLLRSGKVVGLKVYGTLNKACQEKILSMVDIELLYLGQTKGITNKWIGSLSELPRLKKLCLWHTCLSNTGLKKLAESKSLEVLDIRQTKVKDEGFEYLSEITSLKALSAYLVPSIKYAALESLNNLSNLETLLLQRTWNAAVSNYIPKITINRMTDGMNNMEEFNIDFIGYGPVTGLEFIHNLPKLRSLSLSCFSFDESSVDEFSKEIPLDILDISGGFINPTSLANKLFSYLTSIKTLRMHDTRIYNEDEAPEIITHIPNVYYRKKDVIDSHRKQREMCERYFPEYEDSYTNSVYDYKKHFSWDKV